VGSRGGRQVQPRSAEHKSGGKPPLPPCGAGKGFASSGNGLKAAAGIHEGGQSSPVPPSEGRKRRKRNADPGDDQDEDLKHSSNNSR
jgi:hypothetical protein